MTKDDSEGAFTPPPRVASVGSVSHMDSRAEKGTDTTDFEPIIKIEIRGGIPGLNLGSEKDKNNVIQLHFNSPSEVLHYFSQRTVPQLDAFNLLANPELVRNINPELVRNHFLYVPSSQEGVRVSSNGFSGTSSVAQTTPLQGGSPIIVAGPNGGTKTVKQERRRGEVPPGTIIHRNVVLEALPNQFVCWICGMDLQKSLPFEEHMVDQHNVDKPYKCDDCGVTFKRKAHLDRHRRIHLPTRPYQCGICGKGFTRNEHVRRHAFTHSGEKPYNCPTCGKTFSRREHLSKHLLSHTKAGPHSPTQAGHPSQTPGEYDEYMYSPAESPNIQHPPPSTLSLSLQPSPQHQQTQQQIHFSPHETPTSGGGVQSHPGLFHIPQINSQSSQNSISLNKQHRQNLQQGKHICFIVLFLDTRMP
ncbi:Protein odd-skipped [Armadillidium vulgare]|nr:Protein odd-skipped [Armadillidium vulgare]